VIYSPTKDTTAVRRDPGTGLHGSRTCDQCQRTAVLGLNWTRGKVKSGPLRGLNGWICPACKEPKR
jgi:hypothetical protein